MTPERHQRAMALFNAALEVAPESRDTFVRNACGSDIALLDEVCSLLKWEAPATRADLSDRSVRIDPAGAPSSAPRHIGPYEIVGLLGAGGMAVVYRARQKRPDRMVALKVLRPGHGEVIPLLRFRREIDLLARLRHPGIAQIHDAGGAAGGDGETPYFAMELIDGEPLTAFADRHSLDTHQRLELLIRVCEAVEYAHQRGVIHRDLKPGNILVEDTPGMGRPRVLDFGIARLLESAEHGSAFVTREHHVVGTLAYMSPEQLDPDQAIDTRCDVYALGAVGYELLTGRPPLDLCGLSEFGALHRIQSQKPPPLGSIDRTWRGDLSLIFDRALAKQPEARYPSVSAFADDLRAFLEHRPIRARAPGRWYVIRKFAQRNPVAVILTSVIVFAVVAGLVGTTLALQRALAAELRERTWRERADALLDQERQALAWAEATRRANMEHLNVIRSMASDEAGLQAAERAYQMIQESGLDDPGVQMWAAEELGHKRYDLGKVADAAQIWDEAVAIARNEGQIESEHGITILSNLAQCLAQTNQHERAIALYEELIPIKRRAGRDHDSVLATNLNNLGRMLYWRGEHDRAEPNLREALSIHQALHTAPHPDITNASWKYAAVLVRLGRLAEADDLLENCLPHASAGGVDTPRFYGVVRQLAEAHEASPEDEHVDSSTSRAAYWRQALGRAPVKPVTP